MKNTPLGMVLTILMVIAIACSSSDSEAELTSVSLALDWFPNSNHAGIFEAVDRGYFTDEGLDVNIYTPADPSTVLQTVGAGRDDFGISYQPDLLLARNEDVPVVSVMGIVQHPLNSIMTLGSSGLQTPGDLKGMRIGHPNIPSNQGMLATMLASEGLTLDDVELVDVVDVSVDVLVVREIPLSWLISFCDSACLKIAKSSPWPTNERPQVQNSPEPGVSDVGVASSGSSVTSHELT